MVLLVCSANTQRRWQLNGPGYDSHVTAYENGRISDIAQLLDFSVYVSITIIIESFHYDHQLLFYSILGILQLLLYQKLLQIKSCANKIGILYLPLFV